MREINRPPTALDRTVKEPSVSRHVTQNPLLSRTVDLSFAIHNIRKKNIGERGEEISKYSFIHGPTHMNIAHAADTVVVVML